MEKPIRVRGQKAKTGGIYKTSTLTKESIQLVTGYPKHLLEFKCERGFHPTQKPVPLFEYLIRTYTNPGDLILDNCMGSGTTAVAAILSGRDYTGFETDDKYFKVAMDRIANCK